MQEEQQDTCRICSAPAEPDQPLFYPCKCSGTIRYIHQECLTTWLTHSKKKTCDVCKYPYSFTKVYATDMPERLPLAMLLRQLSRQFAQGVLFTIRAVMVGTIWLAVLPWATIWTWRMYFVMGDSTAWWISNRPRPLPVLDSFGPDVPTGNNSTLATANNATSPPLSFLSHPLIRSISSDIVSGQIIASLIVLAFVAIFLLREWISQNARPGVFEDADVPDAAEPIQAPAPPPPELPDIRVREAPQAPVEARALRVRGPIRALHPPRRDDDLARRDVPAHADGELPKYRQKVRRLDETEAESPPIASSSRRDKGKRVDRRGEGVRGRPHHRRPGPSAAGASIGGQNVDDDEQLRKQWDEHLLEWAEIPNQPQEDQPEDPDKPRMTFRTMTPGGGSITLTVGAKQPNPPPLNLDPEKTNFTFTVPRPPPSEPVPSKPDELPTLMGLEKEHHLHWLSSGLHLPPEPERRQGEASTDHDEEDARDQSPPLPSPSKPSNSAGNRSEDVTQPAPVTPAETLGTLRRPPLPNVWLPSSSSSPTSASLSRGATPLASPSLATYRAPEEFEADSPGLGGYFADDEGFAVHRALMEAEHRRYFRDTTEEEDDEGEAELDHERYQWSDFDEVQDDGDDDDDALAEAPFREVDDQVDRDGRAVAVPIGDQRGNAGAGRMPDLNDDLDANLEDDMDGALEAIGLRGPLHGVVQNAALMTFILDATIGLGVWLPFTIGKSTALLSLDPRRLMQILHLPLRAIRLITDPIVDSVILLITRLLLPSIVKAARATLDVFVQAFSDAADPDYAEQFAGICRFLYHYLSLTSSWIWNQGVTFVTSGPDTPAVEAPPSFLDRMLHEDSTLLRLMEPSFGSIGRTVRLQTEAARLTWFRLAIGDGPNEKAFAVLLGYTVVGLLLAIYLNILTVGSVKSAGRAVRSAVRQQLLVVKVAAFIMVELVVFPLGCGVMLDVCTVWLFPQGSFRDRAAFLMFAPVTSIFYHWVFGTVFMYQFAVLLAGCRGIMRPGSMWFIKDPQDQNFHPIRDILDRPTLVQIRKLLLSAVMYGIVVAAGVGTVSGILRLFQHVVMPFRWKIREPLSAVPIDLLFLHLVLPNTLHYFRPKAALNHFGTYLWKVFARQLRLTSYMFGERHSDEEYTSTHWTLHGLITTADVKMDDAEARHDGNFRRVPNSDNIALVKDSPAVVEVDEEGTPINEEQAGFMNLLDAEAEKAKRSIKDDYVVVYIPPHFRYRVAAFIFGIWTVGSAALALALAAPIMLGRGFFKLFITRDVHDGYSFIAGFYLLWACWLVAYAVERMDRRRQRRSNGEEPRAEWPLYVIKRFLLWFAQTAYMAFFCGFVIPTLLALVMELYVVQPVRLMFHPVPDLRIRIIDMWALGLLYSKICVRSMRPLPGNTIMRGIGRILHNGWTNPDPVKATKEVIAPLIAGLLAMIVFPAAVVWGVRRLFPLLVDDAFIFLHVYPSLFTGAGVAHGAVTCSKALSLWSQSIRDKEFLVEMRLRNLEPGQEQETEKEKVVSEQMEDEEED